MQAKAPQKVQQKVQQKVHKKYNKKSKIIILHFWKSLVSVEIEISLLELKM